MPGRPSHRFGWQSNVYSAAAPPNSWKIDGLGPGRLPNMLINWALKGLTDWIDGYMAPIAGTYLHTRVYAPTHVATQLSVDPGPPITVTPSWELAHPAFGGPTISAKQNAQNTGLDQGGAIFDLHVPRGAITLERIRVYVKPATGHSAVPTTLPSITLSSRYLPNHGESVSASATDSIAPAGSAIAGDIAAYESYHYIELAGLGIDLELDTTRYYVIVRGEAGSGSAFRPGLEVRSMEVQYSFALSDAVTSPTEL